MKKYLCIVPLVILLCFVVSCQDKTAMAELEKHRAQAKVEEQNKALVKLYFEEMNRGNIEFIKELYALDSRSYNPSNTPKSMSREEHGESHRMLLRAFPDIHWKMEKLFVVGDAAIIWNIVTGTHQGEFRGIPETGKTVKISSILIWTIKDGKIIEEREETNMLGLMQQLGQELKPKEEKKKWST